MRVTLNGVEQVITTATELRPIFEALRNVPLAELWVTRPEGAHLCLLTNGGRGWLLYLREDADAGCSSRNPEYVGDSAAVLPFRLSNGQVDEYPLAWCLPVAGLLPAVEHFFRTGERPPRIAWHDDSCPTDLPGRPR